MNHYTVEARFERSRFFFKNEFWEGSARNMAIALRRATTIIMKRRGVIRLRHAKVTFFIENVTGKGSAKSAARKG